MNSTYFLVPQNHPIITKVAEFHALLQAKAAAQEALLAECSKQAGLTVTSAAWSRDGLDAVIFADGTPAAPWKRRSHGWVPTGSSQEAKRLRALMRTVRPLTGDDMQFTLTGVHGPMAGTASAGGGVLLRYASYEVIGDTVVLVVPQPSKWEPSPACEILRESTVVRMREMEEEKGK